MYTFLTILIVIASILLILIVLVQNSKGGGLASGFSSSNQIMGVRKTTDFLEKATWVLAAIVILLSIFALGAKKGRQEVNKGESLIKEQIQEAQEATQSNPQTATPGFDEQPITPAEEPAE